jgi:3-hydroxybutyryl-CoA dehydrogenase
MHEIHKIGVIGEGKMGSSIFYYLNDFNFDLMWLCSSGPEKEKALKTYTRKANRLLQSGVLSENQYLSKTENTKVTCSVSDMYDCDLIIEAVTEDAEIKRNLFCTLDKVVNPNCLFTTNSSSIFPSMLVPSESRRDKVAGLHFFFPVALKSTVELITNASTLNQTKESLHQFLVCINKRPFHQNEHHGFILNRILLDLQAGAFQVASEAKLSYREIDELLKQYNFPTGVFEFFDHVGIDVMLASVKSYTKDAENKAFYMPMIQKLEELVSLNHLGIKTRHGFYDYTNSAASVEMSEQSIKADDVLKQDVIRFLQKYYTRSVSKVIESGVCTYEELVLYMKDYLGIDTDPFILNQNL